MSDIDVKKLLDPTGPAVQEAVKGARNEGRVAVAAHWTEIEAALDAGLTVAAIFRVLSKAGLVGVTVRSFQRQVHARREGPRVSRIAENRAAGLSASPASREGQQAPRPEVFAAPASGGAEQSGTVPQRPRRPWQTGPREAPDPKAVFKPRDPLADD